ncbi:MAG: RDD family protein [Bacteroidota bacterium]|nr:RDD family protein [Bacteroidota bacterium]MDP4197137.1 RDD family protein [Bacteroidota bacterium]
MMTETKSLRIEKASSLDRLYALLIDYCIIFILPMAVLIVFNQELNFKLMNTVSQICLLILLFKDVFGRSIGKKIIGLTIVNKLDYTKKVNPFITIIRNFFLIFGILETLVILFTGEKRIADMVTNSIVVKIYKEVPPLKLQDEQFKDDLSEATECIMCGSEIKPNSIKCDNCGWTYKN